MMNLNKVTTSKSLGLSVGVHALLVGVTSIYYLSISNKVLDLSNVKASGGNGRLISLDSFNVSGSRSFNQKTSPQVVSPKITKKVITKTNDPFAKTISKSKEIIQDSVAVEASAITSDGPVGTGTGTSVGGGTGLGNGSGTGEVDPVAFLFAQIKKHFETRLDGSLPLDEDQLIKIKLILNKSGDILSAELIEGKLGVPNLRKVLAVAKNVPVRTYWKGRDALPGQVIVPLFLSSTN